MALPEITAYWCRSGNTPFHLGSYTEATNPQLLTMNSMRQKIVPRAHPSIRHEKPCGSNEARSWGRSAKSSHAQHRTHTDQGVPSKLGCQRAVIGKRNAKAQPVAWTPHNLTFGSTRKCSQPAAFTLFSATNGIRRVALPTFALNE
jgi:hypothetical protein